MKVLLKKKVCESCEQYTEPIVQGTNHNHLKIDFSKKKKKTKQNATRWDVDVYPNGLIFNEDGMGLFFFKNQTGWDLRKGITRHFTAWKSPNDPSPGDFTYGIEMQPHSYPEVYIRKGNKKVLPEFNFNLREMNFDFFPHPNIPCELRTTI